MITAIAFTLLLTSPSDLPPAAPGSAYPIPVQSLRMLCLEAPRIVVARVVAIEHVKRRRTLDARAHLQVERDLKGQGPVETLVTFSPGMICPEPARYTQGTTVLACLYESEGETFTHGLSYGTKTLDEDGVAAYVERVEAFFAIQQATSEGRERRLAETEWLVRCVENRATRIEGAYDLFPWSPEDTAEFGPSFESLLSDEQRERMHRALYSSPEDLDRGELALLSVLKDSEDARLLPFLLQRLRAQLSRQVLPYWCSILMRRVLDRQPDDLAGKLLGRFERADSLVGPARLGLGDPEVARKQLLERFVEHFEVR